MIHISLKMLNFTTCISIIIFCISCTTATIPPKPQSNSITEVYTIDNYNKLHAVEHMTSPSGVIVSINAINVTYVNNDENDSNNKKELILWNNEIQKALLQQGIQIIEENRTITLFDENKQQNQHPSLIIDTLRIERISETLSLLHKHVGTTTIYPYHYYFAEINASISVHNVIVWRGSVRLTSFDLFQQKKLLTIPQVYFTLTSNFSYSNKMKQWISTNPTLSLSDNFSKYLDSNIDSDLHKQQLIALAVTTLLSNIKGGK
ncbi:MAG: hypothetical protein WBK20_09540 [Spirochaetota bacterium]